MPATEFPIDKATGKPYAPIDRDYCYDCETLVNCFTMTLTHIGTGHRWIYEISDFHNDAYDLVKMIFLMKTTRCRMVGFNNLAFDYPLIHFIVETFSRQGYITPIEIYTKAQEIIRAGWNDQNRFGAMIWERDRLVDQLDLLKVHHMDNVAKMTSLKSLEFNMRSESVADIPFDHSKAISGDAVWQTVMPYNAHDVGETSRFYRYSLPMIVFREELSAKLGKDFTNHNDTKIGKDYFLMQLEAAKPGITTRVIQDMDFDGNPIGRPKKSPNQTFRRNIPLSTVIFPYVSFNHPEFNRVLEYLKATTIHNTNKAPELDGLTASINGFEFVFGTGGIHGSVENRTVRADDTHEIVDIDVKSFYPNIAIANRVYPEHLGEMFCDIYADLYQQRARYAKDSAENAMLKLALNGVYGDSNNVYSAFYDPKYTMTITVNGQLLLCRLAEALLTFPQFEIIQINTDGMTMRIPRADRHYLDAVCKDWERWTLLTLEYAEYGAMFIRDVNNYIAVGTDGKTKKRKGAYQWDTSQPNNVSISRTWSQDWSALVVPYAAEMVLVHGKSLTDVLNTHADPFDFMLRAKVNRDSRLVAHWPDHPVTSGPEDEPLQNTTRYHVATRGPNLFKIMPPLKSKPGTADRRFAIQKGWPVKICNRANDFDWSVLNRKYYADEVEKLLKVRG